MFKKPNPKDQMRANDRQLRKAGRDVERDRRELEREEKKLENDIKRLAKSPGNKEAIALLAKQLVNIRKQKTRTYAANSRISSVAAQQKSLQANVKLAGAMGTATKTMVNMNQIMKPEDVAKTMRDFEQASAKLNMGEEIMNDTLDDILNESGDEEESDAIVNQVLDEIGIEIGTKVAGAPMARTDRLGETSRAHVMTDQELEDSLAKLRAT
ncbi:charged multivesicular body protein 2b [Procambarus clarkii]|uniref:charged multivesicular body protein 2b n=1 Tax=Procambarus clarkii TaxID=6728 RepID=UPI001E67031D|nr:charged multivesicular body protein 2b-like [Procambarus clarkii]